MGIEGNQDQFTNGSPIGAAAAEISEGCAQSASETAGSASTAASAMPDIFGAMLGAALTAAAVAEAEAEAAEIVDDATDHFATAQRLTMMATGAEAFADRLELEGQGDVAEFVRIAAKATRKGAKLARRNARDTLTVLDSADDE